jgi:hypothetical protein
MNERKYIGEIEGLMVEILYEYEEGDRGDEFTPPTGDRVTILSWGLLDGEKRVRYEYYDCDDDEWEECMQDIDHYVHNDAEWDIIEFEHELEDLL